MPVLNIRVGTERCGKIGITCRTRTAAEDNFSRGMNFFPMAEKRAAGEFKQFGSFINRALCMVIF